MLDSLNSLIGTTSQKTIDIAFITNYNNIKTDALKSLIDDLIYFPQDDNIDYQQLINLYLRFNVPSGDMLAVEAYFSIGNDASAMTLFNNIPTKYSYSEYEMVQYNLDSYYINLLQNAKSEDRDITQLTDDEYQDLRDIAMQSKGFATALARHVLAWAKREFYNDEINLPGEEKSKKIVVKHLKPKPGTIPSYIKIYPNPVKDNLTIDYHFEKGISNADIFMTDILGKPVFTKKITGNIGVYIIDTQTMPAGIYILKISSEGKAIECKNIAVYR